MVPLGKWSLTNWVPSILDPHSLSAWTERTFWGPFIQGDLIGWGPFVHGDQILGDHRFMGIELVGNCLSRGINKLGPIVGDQMSGDHMRLGPNVSQPISLLASRPPDFQKFLRLCYSMYEHVVLHMQNRLFSRSFQGEISNMCTIFSLLT